MITKLWFSKKASPFKEPTLHQLNGYILLKKKKR